MTFKTVYQIGHLMSMGFLMELKKAAGKPRSFKIRKLHHSHSATCRSSSRNRLFDVGNT